MQEGAVLAYGQGLESKKDKHLSQQQLQYEPRDRKVKNNGYRHQSRMPVIFIRWAITILSIMGIKKKCISIVYNAGGGLRRLETI